MLGVLRPLFRLGLGVWIGSGKQWFSWVVIEDLAQAYIAAIEDDLFEGPMNVVGGSVRQKEFMKALGKNLNRPVFFGVPTLLLQLRYGQLANVNATSQKVTAHRLPRKVSFTYTDIFAALESTL